jgi:hypothetical protein
MSIKRQKRILLKLAVRDAQKAINEKLKEVYQPK